MEKNKISKNQKEKELEQEKIILKEMTKMLEQERSSTKEILSSLSHEFRTPLSVIKTCTDILLSGAYGHLTEQQIEKLVLIRENTTQLISEVFKILKEKDKLAR